MARGRQHRPMDSHQSSAGPKGRAALGRRQGWIRASRVSMRSNVAPAGSSIVHLCGRRGPSPERGRWIAVDVGGQGQRRTIVVVAIIANPTVLGRLDGRRLLGISCTRRGAVPSTTKRSLCGHSPLGLAFAYGRYGYVLGACEYARVRVRVRGVPTLVLCTSSIGNPNAYRGR